MEYQTYPQDRHPLRRLIPLAIAAVILVGLLLIILWFFLGREHPKHESGKSNTGTHQSTKAQPHKSKGKDSHEKPNKTSNNPSSSDQGNASTDNNTDKANPQSTNDQNLSNTGPGDIVALFLIASTLGALYKRRQLRGADKLR
jgi:cytoskeletal protein RodZ